MLLDAEMQAQLRYYVLKSILDDLNTIQMSLNILKILNDIFNSQFLKNLKKNAKLVVQLRYRVLKLVFKTI